MTFADPPFNLKKNYKNYHDSLEVEEYLKWCDEWITEMVGGDLGDEDNQHIREMVDSIDEVIDIIRRDTISVDVCFHYEDEEETIKVYDEEHMRNEFEEKLSNLLNEK
jgi:hypothetical protein